MRTLIFADGVCLAQICAQKLVEPHIGLIGQGLTWKIGETCRYLQRHDL